MGEGTQVMDRFFELSLALLCTARREGNVFENMNPAWERTLGWTREELCSKSFVEFIHPDDLQPTADVIARMDEGQPAVHFENRYLHKNGSWVWLSWVSTLVDGTYYAAAMDITEHKLATAEKQRLSQELLAKERLGVLGQLAGGMAHELRHPLGAIKNAAYYLDMALPSPEPRVRETLEILSAEVANSERIIQSLLDFAGPKPPNREKVQVGRLLTELMGKLDVPNDVEVVLDISQGLPVVLADPLHLQQAIQNVLHNAIQAMDGKGRLTVCAAPKDTGVAIAVSDTGKGIPADNLERIFEPLFTTKSKGIGLGLALAKLLVSAHEGTISARSRPGQGTTLTIQIPAGKGE